MFYAIALIIGLAGGFGAGWMIRLSVAKKDANSAESRAAAAMAKAHEEAAAKLRQADQQAKKLELDGKERGLKLIDEAKLEHAELRKDIKDQQLRADKIDAELRKRSDDLQKQQEELFAKRDKLQEAKEKLEKAKEQQTAKLEAIAQLTQDEAREVLLKEVEKASEEAFQSRLHKIERVHSDELETKAKHMLSDVVQRVASSHSVETTTTNVQLPSDDMKGRIIGKEGRNIKTVELLTGCEIIVDETPETIIISGFSPIRRQVARLALESLIKDGRIHPGRIEEAVEEAKKTLAVDIKKAGEDALYELGIPLTAFDPKLIQILGRLKYRTSYGQNQLRHAIEVAQIATMLAHEIGADVTICKRGGILHDIGKAVDHDMQGAHPEIGYNIMKKFGLPEEICYQSIGHHEDYPKTLEGIVVKAADAISGARPGARKDTYEMYVQRLEDLEKAAHGFPGVEKVYAIQAGREVRVFVNPKEIDDFAAYRLARDVASKVESELKYPGEIRITVIRETRVIEYAK
jgi:ribonuclease Y